MRNLAEQGLQMLNLLGNAMYARPDLDQTEARRYYRRVLQAICRSGETDCDPAVFSVTEEGKMLSEAAMMYIRLQKLRPDPDVLDRFSCIGEFRVWYEVIMMTAAGMQQEYELVISGQQPVASD